MTSQNLQGAQRISGSVGETKRPIHHGGKKGGPRKVLMPKEKAKGLNLEEKRKSLEITKVKEIDDPKLEEIETHAVWEPYNFVRIIYNRQTNEYIYEAIEPELSPDEESTLEFLKTALIKTMEYHFDLVKSKRKDKIEYIRQCAMSVLSSINIRLEENVKERLMYFLLRDFVGYGIIDILMTDEMVEDISCDGPKIPIFVYHKKYESMRSNIQFEDDRQLDSFVIALAQKCGKHISVAEPMLDATIPDGSRLQCTLAREITTRGSSFTIRRFRENPFTPPDLLRLKTLSSEMIAYLWLAVEHGESMMLCGGTACGKTSTLNAILLFVPSNMKMITIEDTREINLPHENWIAGLTRGGFGQKDAHGKVIGEVDMFELLRAALRQRPQYMVVGEVRGTEIYTMFQAMATGHTVYSTMHADSVKSMVYRLENAPVNLPRILMSALKIVVLQSQVRIGKGTARRIRNIVEIVGIEPETNELITNTVYQWNSADDTFQFNGHSFMFERIMAMKNLSTSQMKEEFKRRVEIVEWMGKRNISHHQDVFKIVAGYYKDPDLTIKRVRAELYGKGPAVAKKQ